MKVEEGVVSALFRCHRLILLSLDDYNSCKLPRDLQTTLARLLSAQKYAADCRCALTDSHDWPLGGSESRRHTCCWHNRVLPPHTCPLGEAQCPSAGSSWWHGGGVVSVQAACLSQCSLAAVHLLQQLRKQRGLRAQPRRTNVVPNNGNVVRATVDAVRVHY